MFSGMSKLHCSPYYVACMQAMTGINTIQNKQTTDLKFAFGTLSNGCRSVNHAIDVLCLFEHLLMLLIVIRKKKNIAKCMIDFLIPTVLFGEQFCT